MLISGSSAEKKEQSPSSKIRDFRTVGRSFVLLQQLWDSRVAALDHVEKCIVGAVAESSSMRVDLSCNTVDLVREVSVEVVVVVASSSST